MAKAKKSKPKKAKKSGRKPNAAFMKPMSTSSTLAAVIGSGSMPRTEVTKKLWDGPIVTEVAPASAFYPAEGYHQEYFARNPRQPYCQAVVAPKVAKFRKHFLDKLRK